MPDRPSKKQYELLEFVKKFIGEHGYGPSYRDIMKGCSYSSVATVAVHIDNLIKKGHLRKKDHSARSLEVVGTGLETGKPPEESRDEWLSGLIEGKFKIAESGSSIYVIEELKILVDALKILGFESKAQEFTSRLDGLDQARQ